MYLGKKPTITLGIIVMGSYKNPKVNTRQKPRAP